ncbi:hypothetical protein ACFW9L_04265 [Streptomyces sp. NPDC059517]|uniref:hypothetical protein n=1 Tax=Streptomyces sp. NPDC059517 TaxID=3346855 RepID=UPI003691D1CE
MAVAIVIGAVVIGAVTGLSETLKVGRPSKARAGGHTVEYPAVPLLNRELRPFLSARHPRLRAYALGFARLAGVGDPETVLGDVVP